MADKKSFPASLILSVYSFSKLTQLLNTLIFLALPQVQVGPCIAVLTLYRHFRQSFVHAFKFFHLPLSCWFFRCV